MTYSACIPCLFHHKATQSNNPNMTQTYSMYIPLLLCVALWWNRHGIHVEYVIQSIANSHGLLYLYQLAVMINSHHIPDLFILGIFTPSHHGRCEWRQRTDKRGQLFVTKGELTMFAALKHRVLCTQLHLPSRVSSHNTLQRISLTV